MTGAGPTSALWHLWLLASVGTQAYLWLSSRPVGTLAVSARAARSPARRLPALNSTLYLLLPPCFATPIPLPGPFLAPGGRCTGSHCCFSLLMVMVAALYDMVDFFGVFSGSVQVCVCHKVQIAASVAIVVL